MKCPTRKTILRCLSAFCLAASPVLAAPIIFDDFNASEGHFNSSPTLSGSNAGVGSSSTADRVTTDAPREGTGHEQIIVTTNGAPAVRLRFLSGVGTPANNTAFTTTSGTDGWIGFYVKTTNTGWNVQLWIEGAGANNGGVPRDLVADGEWHLYEWNLDDETGGPDGWGGISGILGGSIVVSNGSHTIDSVIFRNSAVDIGTNVFFMDFVALNDSGSVSNLLATQDPCVNVPGVLVTGPLGTNSNQVIVTGASLGATNINVYQKSGPGGTPVVIGGLSGPIAVGANNTVIVSGLIKNAEVMATQTIGGQESCVPANGIFVGGGANPSVRVALSLRETTGTGPIGTANPDDPQSSNIHFLGASAVSGSAPTNATIIYPSNDWQTLTFEYKLETVGTLTVAEGKPVAGTGYPADDYVGIEVYAYRMVGPTRVYSATPAYAAPVTSNTTFNVNWTWEPVVDAEGYRLLRSTNFAAVDTYVDVVGDTNYADTGSGWTLGTTVTPTQASATPAIQWFPSIGNPDNIGTPWGILEAIALVIDGDTGPFNFYLDDLQNGTTVFQDFEGAAPGTVDFGFRAPSFSGSTDVGLLPSPDIGEVSGIAAASGANSFRVSYQWNGTNTSRWLRLTTSGVGNPMVDLSQPISFKMLLLPAGTAPPSLPTLTIQRFGNDTVLDWAGTYNLLASSVVSGPYTNVPSVNNGPWTNTYTESVKFFRLGN